MRSHKTRSTRDRSIPRHYCYGCCLFFCTALFFFVQETRAALLSHSASLSASGRTEPPVVPVPSPEPPSPPLRGHHVFRGPGMFFSVIASGIFFVAAFLCFVTFIMLFNFCFVCCFPFFFFSPFQSSGGLVKIKLKLPHFHESDTCRLSVQPDAPVATAARAAATGRVSMSDRPDPERSGAVEIATLFLVFVLVPVFRVLFCCCVFLCLYW